MTREPADNKPSQKLGPTSREARLAEALRKNLRRRKDAKKSGKSD